jgi:hypothetical protein
MFATFMPWETNIELLNCLKVRFNDLTSLPSPSYRNLHPASYISSFHTNHIFPSNFRFKVAHGRSAFSPWIPHDNILEVLSLNSKESITAGDNGFWRGGFVDTICRAGDLDCLCIFGQVLISATLVRGKPWP